MGSREAAVRLIPHYSTFVSSLSSIAWLLNLRGGDVPHNPLFHAYLWVGVDKATLFVDARKLGDEVKKYLRDLKISIREVSEVWGYLRKREFGSGKVSRPVYLELEGRSWWDLGYYSAQDAVRRVLDVDVRKLYHRAFVCGCDQGD